MEKISCIQNEAKHETLISTSAVYIQIYGIDISLALLHLASTPVNGSHTAYQENILRSSDIRHSYGNPLRCKRVRKVRSTGLLRSFSNCLPLYAEPFHEGSSLTERRSICISSGNRFHSINQRTVVAQHSCSTIMQLSCKPWDKLVYGETTKMSPSLVCIPCAR